MSESFRKPIYFLKPIRPSQTPGTPPVLSVNPASLTLDRTSPGNVSTFTASLNVDPGSPVAVTATSSDPSVTISPSTFNLGGGNPITRTVTLTGALAGPDSVTVSLSAPGQSTRTVGVSRPAFTPGVLSGLSLWLDAADSSSITLDGSNNVSQWNDKSGNARHAIQASASARPSYLTNQLNGLGAVRPSSLARWLEIANFPSLAAGYSVFAVVQSPGSADCGVLSLNAGVANSALVIATANAGVLFNSQWGDSVNQPTPANNTNFAFWTHYDGAHNTGNFSMHLSTQASTAAKAMTQLAGTPPSGTMFLMQYTNGNWWTRNFYELIVYNRITTIAEDDAIKAYVTSKWGITWS